MMILALLLFSLLLHSPPSPFHPHRPTAPASSSSRSLPTSKLMICDPVSTATRTRPRFLSLVSAVLVPPSAASFPSNVHVAPSTVASATPFALHVSRSGLQSKTSPWFHDVEDGSRAVYGSAFRLSRASLDARFYNASRLIIVDKSGFGHFHTIQAAVNAIPINNTHVYTIFVAGGLFEEKVVFPHNKRFIRLQGLGSDDTIITWNDTASTFSSPADSSHKSPASTRPLGTFHSATVAINGPDFIARSVTFQNTAPAPDGGQAGGQAVALQVSGDQAAFYDCKFRGKQDTLYDHKGRHYFRNCYIEGSIDFIFGDGLSLYKGCMVYSVGSGFITAQKRQNASEDSGFSFVECNITGVGQGINVYLGRAWGAFSRVIYASCYMDAMIVPDGWHNWGDPSKEATVYYSEFNCTGPGADSSGRVSWSRQLNQSQAVPFVDVSFVQGNEWLPYE